MVAPWKMGFVSEVKGYLQDYPVVGIVDLTSLPALQTQEMREKFRDSILVRGGRKTLIIRALQEAKVENAAELVNHISGLPALIFSKDNAFSLYKKLQKNKSAAVAKAGQVAPKDIIIKAGNTGMNPGPINTELGMLGIKAGVENGKVTVKEDKLVAKEGDVISENLASILQKLKIEPMEIGLNINVLLEKGTIFDKKTLHIDEDEYLAQITSLHQGVMNLALNVGLLLPETTELLLAKAHSDVVALARAQDLMIPDLVGDVLAKAERSAQSVLAEAEKAKPKQEEKPVEQPTEQPQEQPQEEVKQEEPKKEQS